MKHYKVDLLGSFVYKSFKKTTNIDFAVNLWFPCLDDLIQTRLRPIRARVIYMLFFNNIFINFIRIQKYAIEFEH